MRATALTFAAMFGLLLTSCGGGPGSEARNAGDLKPRDFIVGTWQVKQGNSPLQPHIQGYEFAADNTMKVVCLGAKDAIRGKYMFDTDYTMEVEYDQSEDALRAYAAAVKSYKDSGTAITKKAGGEVAPQALGVVAGMFDRIPDELSAKERLRIAVKSVGPGGDKQPSSDRAIELIVVNEQKFSLTYRKVE